MPILALDPGEFVHPPQAAPTIATVDAQHLLAQVQRVLPAAGADPTLPTLTGVGMTLDGQTLTLSTTDRYRFAVVDLPASTDAAPQQHPHSALIPADTLTRLTKRLKGHQGPVGIGISEDGTPRVTLTMGTTTVTIRQMAGSQVGHAAFFPKAVDTSLTIDRATALRALKKCHAMIKAMGGKESPVTFAWAETGTLTLAPRIGTDQEQARTKGMTSPPPPSAETPPGKWTSPCSHGRPGVVARRGRFGRAFGSGGGPCRGGRHRHRRRRYAERGRSLLESGVQRPHSDVGDQWRALSGRLRPPPPCSGSTEKHIV
ncbi:hypothetical protein [Streptomyces sp. NPDC086010]|uniref:DNA polymerase III subunit beta family protein n=1 Tax=Streptomyces sp. NPDC086010 TaxID=3365745 RepID=UPI0037D8923F